MSAESSTTSIFFLLSIFSLPVLSFFFKNITNNLFPLLIIYVDILYPVLKGASSVFQFLHRKDFSHKVICFLYLFTAQIVSQIDQCPVFIFIIRYKTNPSAAARP